MITKNILEETVGFKGTTILNFNDMATSITRENRLDRNKGRVIFYEKNYIFFMKQEGRPLLVMY